MRDYQLVSTALDHADGAFETYVLENLLDQLRLRPERRIGEDYRAFAQEILDRGLTTIMSVAS